MPLTFRGGTERARTLSATLAATACLSLGSAGPAFAETRSFDGGAPSAGSAASAEAFAHAFPGATAVTRSARRKGQIVAPELTSVGDHLTVVGALGAPTIAKDPAGGFVLDTAGGPLRIAPAWTDATAPAPATVDDVAALFPALATQVDALLRPTAAGLTTVLQLNSALASETYSWTASLPVPFSLRQLSDGGVAVVTAADGAGAPAPRPAAREIDADDLSDSGAQHDDAQAAEAAAEQDVSDGDVLAVLAPPRAQDRRGRAIPAALAVHGETVELTVQHRKGTVDHAAFAELAVTAPEVLDRPWHYLEGTGPVQRAADGLLKVKLDSGEVLLSHGPDPAPTDRSEGEDPLGDGLLAGPPDPTEDEGDVEDAGTGPPYLCAYGPKGRAIRVLYAGPKGAAGLTDSTLARIRRVMIAANNKLYDEAVTSGGRSKPARFRFDCDKQYDIGVFPYELDDGDFVETIKRAKLAGHTNRAFKYVIFSEFPDDDACGEANQYPDDRLSRDNLANRGAFNETVEGPRVFEGTYAILYGRFCWQTDIAMHENAHTMGAVEDPAPHATGRGHCNDGWDVMCYDDREEEEQPYTYRTDDCPLGPRGTRYDCNYDTYFDTDPEKGEWLDRHWNLGHEFNTALSFQATRSYQEPFVFFGTDRDGVQGVYRASDDQAKDARLVEEGNTFMTALSPNAESIVAAVPNVERNCFELYHSRVDGTERRKLFDCADWTDSSSNPAFAGSNAKIVFDCHVDGGHESDICGMELDGTPEGIVTWDGLQFQPDESGSRRLLTFASTRKPNGELASEFPFFSQIFITKRDGSEPIQFTSNPRFYHAQNPKFSQDGNWIAFEGFVDGDETAPSIYVARTDGTGLKRITSGFEARSPTWTPTGYVVYTSRENSDLPQLIKENVTTGETRELTPGLNWSAHAAFRQAAYWQLDYTAPVPQPIP
jgi:hypothetical protein